jgi:GNAT superfamily N-acetyltransferase
MDAGASRLLQRLVKPAPAATRVVTYQIECWDDYARDAAPLWAECFEDHADEGLSLRPQVEAYAAMEDAGLLRILTARDNAALVGYIIFVVHRHMHHEDVLCGFEDSFFLAKAHRRGLTGAKLIREGVHLLRAEGVQRIFFTTDRINSAGPFLERLGFAKSNTVYSLWTH